MPKAHRDYHPAKHTRAEGAKTSRRKVEIPKGVEQFEIRLSGREVKLTNLKKLFWLDLKITKRDLIQYYSNNQSGSRTFRRISVTAPAHSELRVRAREGYYPKAK